jgi:hypothetical protein
LPELESSGRRPQSAGAHHQHPPVQEPQLAGDPYLGHQQMTRVAGLRIRVEHALNGEGNALVRPAIEAAGEVAHVPVAQAPQVLGGGEQRALADHAEDHQGAVLVGHPVLDVDLQIAAPQGQGARRRDLGNLLRLAHVHEDRSCLLQLQGLARGHLGDARAQLRHAAFQGAGTAAD